MALKLKGSTSGFVAIDAPSVAGNNTLILPENSGSAFQLFANDITAGVTTFTSVSVNRNGDLTVPGTISIGGTLTYEDVTSVDSVGIVTARGLSIFGNTTGLQVASGISTFQSATFAGDIDIADKIVHTGDTNTAIRFPAADTISFECAGEEILKIGKSSTELLRISGPIDASTQQEFGIGIAVNDAHTHPAAKITFKEFDASDSRGDLLFYTRETNSDSASTERLRITSAGKVGIGTNNPAEEFHLYGNSAVVVLVESIGANDSRVRIKAPSDRISYLEFADDDADAGEIRYDHTNNYMGFHVNNNVERLRITSTGNVEVVGLTSTASLTVGPGLIQEEFDSYASALTGTYNHDVVDHGMILYAYSNASASFVLNLRGDGSTTLNSLMNIGQSSVFTAYTGSNNTSYYMTDFQIDGSSQTEEWNGASAPSAGTGSGYDVYTFNILKTADATFKVFATFSNFA